MDDENRRSATAMLKAANEFPGRCTHRSGTGPPAASTRSSPSTILTASTSTTTPPSSWFFRGLPLRALNTAQRAKADALLAARLSRDRLLRVKRTAQLESVLAYRERGNVVLVRGTLAYFISILRPRPRPRGRLPPQRARAAGPPLRDGARPPSGGRAFLLVHDDTAAQERRETPFEQRIRMAGLAYVEGSRAAPQAIAGNYVGLPFDFA